MKLGPFPLNTIQVGDARELAKQLPDNSIHCIVTSPPYWGLRDYGVDGQIGLEATVQVYVAEIVMLFRELRRALRPDGTLWLNLGDSYATSANGRSASDTRAIGNDDRTFRDKPFNTAVGGLKPKDLCGIPWRCAFALQDDGWWLRSDIIWSKVNPMPESVTDRPSQAHEYIFLLTKSERYFYDAEAVKEPLSEATLPRTLRGVSDNHKNSNGAPGQTPHTMSRARKHGEGYEHINPDGRNRRNVWHIATHPFPEAHFATFPEKLVEPCILAGTSARGVCDRCGSPWVRVIEKELSNSNDNRPDRCLPGRTGNGHNKTRAGDSVSLTTGWQPSCSCGLAETVPAVVFDPFMGAGTTAVVAKRFGLNWLGFELNPAYADIANKRIAETQPALPIFNNQSDRQDIKQLSLLA